MSSSATVSVILPVFNGDKHVLGAIRSIATQTVLPEELIVVDDGSTDDSSKAIRAAIRELPPGVETVVIEQANQGQSAARNAAAERSRGELLAFLDQDDRWYPRHLELLTAPFLRSPELGWAYSDFDEIDGSGLVVTRGFMSYHGYVHPKRSIVQLLGVDNMVLPSASIIRREALHEVGGFDPRLRGYEDDDLFIRIFQAGWSSEFLAESLAAFRIHHGSSSSNSSFRASRMIFFGKLLELFPDDHRMNRLYVSDLIVPRMVASTLAEYSFALRSKQFQEARSIATCVSTLLAARTRVTLRQRLGTAVLGRPRLCRAVIALLRGLPRALRPRLGASTFLMT